MWAVLRTKSVAPAARLLTRESTRFQSTAVKSSCLAGTKLNLDIYKNGKEPVALTDEEYPPWLWEVIKPEQDKSTTGVKKARGRNKNLGDNTPTATEPKTIAERKKLIRKQRREQIKQANYLSQV